jgi:hypothetical protein
MRSSEKTGQTASLPYHFQGFEAEQDFMRSMGPGKEPEASLEPPIEEVPAAEVTNRRIQ